MVDSHTIGCSKWHHRPRCLLSHHLYRRRKGTIVFHKYAAYGTSALLVYACMYMYSESVSVCLSACMCVYMHVRVCTCLCVCVHACMVCICVHMQVNYSKTLLLQTYWVSLLVLHADFRDLNVHILSKSTLVPLENSGMSIMSILLHTITHPFSFPWNCQQPVWFHSVCCLLRLWFFKPSSFQKWIWHIIVKAITADFNLFMGCFRYYMLKKLLFINSYYASELTLPKWSIWMCQWLMDAK